MDLEDGWRYLDRTGEIHGPISKAELLSYLQGGAISHETQVHHHQMGWRWLGHVLLGSGYSHPGGRVCRAIGRPTATQGAGADGVVAPPPAVAATAGAAAVAGTAGGSRPVVQGVGKGAGKVKIRSREVIPAKRSKPGSLGALLKDSTAAGSVAATATASGGANGAGAGGEDEASAAAAPPPPPPPRLTAAAASDSRAAPAAYGSCGFLEAHQEPHAGEQTFLLPPEESDEEGRVAALAAGPPPPPPRRRQLAGVRLRSPSPFEELLVTELLEDPFSLRSDSEIAEGGMTAFENMMDDVQQGAMWRGSRDGGDGGEEAAAEEEAGREMLHLEMPMVVTSCAGVAGATQPRERQRCFRGQGEEGGEEEGEGLVSPAKLPVAAAAAAAGAATGEVVRRAAKRQRREEPQQVTPPRPARQQENHPQQGKRGKQQQQQQQQLLQQCNQSRQQPEAVAKLGQAAARLQTPPSQKSPFSAKKDPAAAAKANRPMGQPAAARTQPADKKVKTQDDKTVASKRRKVVTEPDDDAAAPMAAVQRPNAAATNHVAGAVKPGVKSMVGTVMGNGGSARGAERAELLSKPLQQKKQRETGNGAVRGGGGGGEVTDAAVPEVARERAAAPPPPAAASGSGGGRCTTQGPHRAAAAADGNGAAAQGDTERERYKDRVRQAPRGGAAAQPAAAAVNHLPSPIRLLASERAAAAADATAPPGCSCRGATGTSDKGAAAAAAAGHFDVQNGKPTQALLPSLPLSGGDGGGGDAAFRRSLSIGPSAHEGNVAGCTMAEPLTTALAAAPAAAEVTVASSAAAAARRARQAIPLPNISGMLGRSIARAGRGTAAPQSPQPQPPGKPGGLLDAWNNLAPGRQEAMREQLAAVLEDCYQYRSGGNRLVDAACVLQLRDEVDRGMLAETVTVTNGLTGDATTVRGVLQEHAQLLAVMESIRDNKPMPQVPFVVDTPLYDTLPAVPSQTQGRRRTPFLKPSGPDGAPTGQDGDGGEADAGGGAGKQLPSGSATLMPPPFRQPATGYAPISQARHRLYSRRGADGGSDNTAVQVPRQGPAAAADAANNNNCIGDGPKGEESDYYYGDGGGGGDSLYMYEQTEQDRVAPPPPQAAALPLPLPLPPLENQLGKSGAHFSAPHHQQHRPLLHYHHNHHRGRGNDLRPPPLPPPPLHWHGYDCGVQLIDPGHTRPRPPEPPQLPNGWGRDQQDDRRGEHGGQVQEREKERNKATKAAATADTAKLPLANPTPTPNPTPPLLPIDVLPPMHDGLPPGLGPGHEEDRAPQRAQLQQPQPPTSQSSLARSAPLGGTSGQSAAAGLRVPPGLERETPTPVAVAVQRQPQPQQPSAQGGHLPPHLRSAAQLQAVAEAAAPAAAAAAAAVPLAAVAPAAGVATATLADVAIPGWGAAAATATVAAASASAVAAAAAQPGPVGVRSGTARATPQSVPPQISQVPEAVTTTAAPGTASVTAPLTSEAAAGAATTAPGGAATGLEVAASAAATAIASDAATPALALTKLNPHTLNLTLNLSHRDARRQLQRMLHMLMVAEEEEPEEAAAEATGASALGGSAAAATAAVPLCNTSETDTIQRQQSQQPGLGGGAAGPLPPPPAAAAAEAAGQVPTTVTVSATGPRLPASTAETAALADVTAAAARTAGSRPMIKPEPEGDGPLGPSTTVAAAAAAAPPLPSPTALPGLNTVHFKIYAVNCFLCEPYLPESALDDLGLRRDAHLPVMLGGDEDEDDAEVWLVGDDEDTEGDAAEVAGRGERVVRGVGMAGGGAEPGAAGPAAVKGTGVGGGYATCGTTAVNEAAVNMLLNLLRV
ncbi:hypothetical protein VOLCADRAFT_120108 [Volvox carteri f. nagariensis]|uniref:GYF domain-containing protein n=1 Tax=Volvox carteri f. nagariensis TaxID=3068 RepID=D8UKK1_VOLCA|nr:uncharacterized protein VOLCADRAFT_120108 [Volvox carteri f. nagariensis]EFJ39745.1 hypothetical protein VOLCADRAFT_120108 [Volvox carteri f. nagariensis]|eukprot:XP_002959183.1 hypothetical protein VOLCADRAFT_120108 [Volvox carteri f. nagariensis]